MGLLPRNRKDKSDSELNLGSYFVHWTSVKQRPWDDYIVIMHPTDMKSKNLHEYDYVLLRHTVGTLEKKQLEIQALVISKDNKFSNMGKLSIGNIGVDQTYREALFVKVHEELEIYRTDKTYNNKEKFLGHVNFQKVVLRVQYNSSYMEQQIPVACISEEILEGLGIKYGDRIIIESPYKNIEARCAKLDPNMTKFHEKLMEHPFKVTVPQIDIECGETCCETYRVDKSASNKNNTSQKIINPIKFGHFKFPEDYGVVSGDESVFDIIHPIFIDSMAADQLGIKPFDLVKVRRAFKSELMKRITDFGSVGALGLSVLLPILFTQDTQDKIPFLVASVVLGIFVTITTIFGPKYQSNL